MGLDRSCRRARFLPAFFDLRRRYCLQIVMRLPYNRQPFIYNGLIHAQDPTYFNSLYIEESSNNGKVVVFNAALLLTTLLPK